MNLLLHKNNPATDSLMTFRKSKASVQPKLTVNEPGDMYEQEADAMADRIMRMSSNETVKPVTGLIGKSLQRKCTHCEEEEKNPPPLMRKTENGNSGIQVSSSFATSLNSTKGGGSPLPQGTKSFMENAFSTDFSSVRVHTDGKASEMSKGIQAKAFTHGSDIYFNEGQYNPGSSEGKRLLGHELTHTVQQGKSNTNFKDINSFLQRQSVEQFIPTGIRPLSQPERIAAQAVYQNSIVYPMVLISNATGMNNRPYTLHTGNKNTVIQVGRANYNNISPRTLIHELAHSWQCQHGLTGFEYMINSLESQAIGGSGSYCFIPGKWFGSYGAEQIANQAEKGVSSIVSHMASVSPLMPDLANMTGLSIPRWEKKGDPGVIC